jgi:PAS domain S-box-containing protein
VTHPAAIEPEERELLIAEYSSDVIAVLDPGGVVQYVSPACKALFGYEREELVGRSAYDFVDSEGAAEAERTHALALDGAELVTTRPYRVRRKDDSLIWVETTVRPVRDPDGLIRELHSTTRDVTERRQAQVKLALARDLAVGIGEAKTVDAALQLALQEICETTGWVLGQAWIRNPAGSGLACSRAWHTAAEGLEQFRRASESITLSRGEALPGCVWRDKKPVWIKDIRADRSFIRFRPAIEVGLGSAMAVPILARDEVIAVLEFFMFERREQDQRLIELVSTVAAQLGSLIEHKRAEEELRKSEARYRLLAVNSTDVIAATDPDGVLRYVSPGCRTLSGYEPEELVGRPGIEFVHPNDSAQIVEALAPLPERASITHPYRVRCKDGSYVWVESTVKAIRDRATGAVLEVQSSTRDLTRRKEAEQVLRLANAELERSNRALEQFAYDVSHDLAEPIRVMSQVVERFARDRGDRLDPQSRRLIVAITDGLERMRMLISDLLEYSRVSRDPPRRENVKCTALLCDTLKVLEETISEKQASVTCDSLPTVKAHPTQLRQVFQNLVSNALKFAVEPPLRVHLSAAREPDAWCFSVEDNGIGIDPKDARGVFEMFRRLNAKDSYAGTGMGLSICKRIVEHHGGRIWVESNPAGGSVFKFTIPDDPRPEESPAVGTSPAVA